MEPPMKSILLALIFVSNVAVSAEDKNIVSKSTVKNSAIETLVKKAPCEQGPETQECKDFLKDSMSKFPCADDVVKLCSPKDLTNSDLNKNINVDVMNKCLEKNMNKLSKACQKSLEIKIGFKECINAAAAKCAGLKPDKEIDCMADVHVKAVDDCKNNFRP